MDGRSPTGYKKVRFETLFSGIDDSPRDGDRHERPSGLAQSSDSSVDRSLAAKLVGTTVRCAIPVPDWVVDFRPEGVVAAITNGRTPATPIKLLMLIMHAADDRR
jgi:hypothetical protein